MKANYKNKDGFQSANDRINCAYICSTILTIVMYEYSEEFNCKSRAMNNLLLACSGASREYDENYCRYGHDIAIDRDNTELGFVVPIRKLKPTPFNAHNQCYYRYATNCLIQAMRNKHKPKYKIQRIIDRTYNELSKYEYIDHNTRAIYANKIKKKFPDIKIDYETM